MLVSEFFDSVSSPGSYGESDGVFSIGVSGSVAFMIFCGFVVNVVSMDFGGVRIVPLFYCLFSMRLCSGAGGFVYRIIGLYCFALLGVYGPYLWLLGLSFMVGLTVSLLIYFVGGLLPVLLLLIRGVWWSSGFIVTLAFVLPPVLRISGAAMLPGLWRVMRLWQLLCCVGFRLDLLMVCELWVLGVVLLILLSWVVELSGVLGLS